MTACASCGRDNEPAAQFCMDGGKPLKRAAALETAAAGAGGQGAVSVPGTRTVVAHSARAMWPPAPAVLLESPP